VLQVRDDPQLRRRLVERGVERVKQFRWTTAAQQMADLLRQAAAFRRRA
jgi:glycosyltransferase involved in cell wall biosynthesis